LTCSEEFGLLSLPLPLPLSLLLIPQILSLSILHIPFKNPFVIPPAVAPAFPPSLTLSPALSLFPNFNPSLHRPSISLLRPSLRTSPYLSLHFFHSSNPHIFPPSTILFFLILSCSLIKISLSLLYLSLCISPSRPPSCHLTGHRIGFSPVDSFYQNFIIPPFFCDPNAA
jgi:hypothetical protein